MPILIKEYNNRSGWFEIMTRNVCIKIKGLQPGFGDEPIETTLFGSYGKINGKHCISYEDKLSGSDAVTKNLIKASCDQVSVTKKNGVETKLIFDINEITSADYHTPYGNLNMSIKTKSIKISDNPDSFELNMEYSLFAGGSLISDNQVNIFVTPA